jgi:hypothetical protein
MKNPTSSTQPEASLLLDCIDTLNARHSQVQAIAGVLIIDLIQTQRIMTDGQYLDLLDALTALLAQAIDTTEALGQQLFKAGA